MLDSILVKSVRACFSLPAPVFVTRAEKQRSSKQYIERALYLARLFNLFVLFVIQVGHDIRVADYGHYIGEVVQDEHGVLLAVEFALATLDVIRLPASEMRIDAPGFGAGANESLILRRKRDSANEEVFVTLMAVHALVFKSLDASLGPQVQIDHHSKQEPHNSQKDLDYQI